MLLPCLYVLLPLLATGCRSRREEAIDQAKRQAAATGQAQQVVSVDKNGNTITTIVQPPVPGQSGQVITTTVTPGVAPNGVTVSPAPGTSTGGMGGAGVPAAAPVVANTAAAAPALPSDTAAAGTTASLPAAVPGGYPSVRPAAVDLPAGTDLTIRINQHIGVKTSRAGERFTGEVAEAIAQGGQVIVPRGTPVGGVIDASHRRGHFKGSSILELRLTSMTLNGRDLPIQTRDLVRTKKGKGKRSTAFIGGGAGLGMLIGGVASGGMGLLAGGLAGGGAGTAIAGLTGNRDLDLPAESLVRFRLSDDLVVQAP